MKKFYVNLIVAMMSGMMITPQVEAGERVSSSDSQSMQRSAPQAPGFASRLFIRLHAPLGSRQRLIPSRTG